MKRIIFFVLSQFVFASIIAQDNKINSNNWHRIEHNEAYGIGSQDAMEILHKKKMHSKNIVLAIIDSGADTNNVYISGSLLKNKDKTFAGWNFLGSSDGKNNPASIGKESFRVMQKLYNKYSNIENPESLSKTEREEYEKYKLVRGKSKVDSYLQFAQLLQTNYKAFSYLDSVIISQKMNRDMPFKELNKIDYSMIPDSMEPLIEQVGSECMKAQYKGLKTWKEAYDGIADEYKLSVQRLKTLGDARSNPRYTIGDDPENFQNLRYGNSNIMCDSYEHGTAMCSIVSSSHPEVQGIFPEARILTLRATSVGDAFDKDIYVSVLYAVDNGAKVILIPAFKEFFDNAQKFNDALNYARQKDVLVVLSAGDNAQEITEVPSMDNVMIVGACNVAGAKLVKSNYSPVKVDAFAPGENISTINGKGEIVSMSGTDVASSVTAGLVCMIRSYFPKLTAAQVKQIICENTKQMPDSQYKAMNEVVTFKPQDLSRSGGVVNAKRIVEKLLN